MRAPNFWWRPNSILALLLTPVSWLYSSIAARRLTTPAHRINIPVICVGNFIVGGAGKTPTAIALCTLLKELGEKPFFLSRGYGGQLEGPLLVKPEQHSHQEVGDEALLLCRHAPTIVSRNRVAGADFASEMGASVIIMDDGMQNPSLAKDLTFAVIDGAIGNGNGNTLPAGPLRLPMKLQWPLADAIIIIGPGHAGQALAITAQTKEKKAINAELQPSANVIERMNGRRVLAFAGIGRPEKFFTTLRACGAVVERSIAFPDHHDFSASELESLALEAEEKKLQLVTTEKDYIRITTKTIAQDIDVLPITLSLNQQEIIDLLQDKLKGYHSSSSPNLK